MLRAYGKFDVAAGTFALFSEIAVKDNRVEGYVKLLQNAFFKAILLGFDAQVAAARHK